MAMFNDQTLLRKKHANSEVQKPTDVCIFLLPSIIFADLLAT